MVIFAIILFILIAYRAYKLFKILTMKEFWIGILMHIIFSIFFGLSISYIIDFQPNNEDFMIFLSLFAIIAWFALVFNFRTFRLPVLFVLGAVTLGLVVFGVGDMDVDASGDVDLDFDPDSPDFPIGDTTFSGEFGEIGMDNDFIANFTDNGIDNSFNSEPAYSSMQEWSTSSLSDLTDATASTVAFPTFTMDTSGLDTMRFEGTLNSSSDSTNIAMMMNIPEDAIMFDHDLNGNGELDFLERDIDQDGNIDFIDNDFDNDGMPDQYDNDLDNDGMPDQYDRDLNNNFTPDFQERDIDQDGNIDYMKK